MATPPLPSSRATDAPAHLTGDRALGLALFLGVAAVYLLSPVRVHIDGVFAIHVALSFLDGQWGDLSGVANAAGHYATMARDGRVLTMYPLGTPLLLVPALAVLDLVAPEYLARVAAANSTAAHKSLASLISAASVAVLWHGLRVRFDRGVSIFLCLSFAFGTSTWSTWSRSLWQHGLLGLAYAATLYFLLRARDRPSAVQWAGLTLAAAYIARPTAALPAAIITVLVLVCHRPWFLRYVTWAACLLGPWLALNVAVYQVPLPPYYLPWGFAPWSRVGEGLLGTLVSPSRGLLLFSPVLLAAIPGAVAGWRDPSGRALVTALTAILVGHLITVSRLGAWWGGHCFGPRLPSDVVPFLIVLMGFALAPAFAHRTRLARVAIVLALISVAAHAQGAIWSDGYTWNTSPRDVDVHPERLWDWHDPQILSGVRRWRGLP